MEDKKKAFKSILDAGRRYNASDIHLIANLPPAYRIAGEITMANYSPLSAQALTDMVDAVLNDKQLQDFEEKRELSISYYDQAYGRIRLSLYHRLDTPEMAIRLCNTEVLTLEQLNLPKAVDKFSDRTSGLILITGPTGSGKTTTMNYMIDSINVSRKGKIITIEDPVEFSHSNRKSIVVQLEVGTDTESFASCLRHVLRLDPDVICVGEMRDLDTIETALTAAETGHLVIATLHTPSATGAIERIVNVFDGKRQRQVMMQLSEILHMVMAQRLVASVDKKQRILATELFVLDSGSRNIIRDGANHRLRNALHSSRSKGSHTMADSLGNLYQQGQITYDVAVNNCNEPDELASVLKRVIPKTGKFV